MASRFETIASIETKTKEERQKGTLGVRPFPLPSVLIVSEILCSLLRCCSVEHSKLLRAASLRPRSRRLTHPAKQVSLPGVVPSCLVQSTVSAFWNEHENVTFSHGASPEIIMPHQQAAQPKSRRPTYATPSHLSAHPPECHSLQWPHRSWIFPE